MWCQLGLLPNYYSYLSPHTLAHILTRWQLLHCLRPHQQIKGPSILLYG